MCSLTNSFRVVLNLLNSCTKFLYVQLWHQSYKNKRKGRQHVQCVALVVLGPMRHQFVQKVSKKNLSMCSILVKEKGGLTYHILMTNE